MSESYFIIAKHISWQNVGGRVFIFDENNKGVMMLDEVSTAFWCYLEKGFMENDISFKMIKEYDVDYVTVKSDIAKFINLLKCNKIIV